MTTTRSKIKYKQIVTNILTISGKQDDGNGSFKGCGDKKVYLVKRQDCPIEFCLSVFLILSLQEFTVPCDLLMDKIKVILSSVLKVVHNTNIVKSAVWDEQVVV